MKKYYYEIRTEQGEYSRGSYAACVRECRSNGIDMLYRYEISSSGVEIDSREVHYLGEKPGAWESA